MAAKKQAKIGYSALEPLHIDNQQYAIGDPVVIDDEHLRQQLLNKNLIAETEIEPEPESGPEA